MRLYAIAAVLVAAGPAIAAPRTWDAWVGDFKGALVWRQCTAPGETVVAVAIDAVDGAIRVDLTSAGAALRIFSLQQDAAGWSAQDGDLSIAVAQKKRNTIDLAITYDSGCTARGQLARASTGVPACDALVGWTRIEAACTKTTDKHEAIETKFKKADAARCTSRADKLALAMIDAGCAPHPDPSIGTRAVACRSLADATAKLARCTRVPREIMQRLSGTASALSSAAQTAEKATLTFVEQQCKDARADVNGTAVQFGCQL
jgi:hypothetical protein